MSVPACFLLHLLFAEISSLSGYFPCPSSELSSHCCLSGIRSRHGRQRLGLRGGQRIWWHLGVRSRASCSYGPQLDRQRGSDGVTRGPSGPRLFCRRRGAEGAARSGQWKLGGGFIKQDFRLHRSRSITVSNILLISLFHPFSMYVIPTGT